MFNFFKTNDKVLGIEIAQFVASWYMAGGFPVRDKIEAWLESIEIDGQKLTEDEVQRVATAVMTGKCELQQFAKPFVKD